MTKKIRVLRTFDFADPGEDSQEYLQGQTYDVTDECATVAIEEHRAELAE